MAGTNFPQWPVHYLQALQEPLGSPVLSQRVKDAEMSITRRIQELRASPPKREERKDIADALRSLRYVKTENFEHSAGFASQQGGPE
jgi:hypothetical protein